MNALTDFCLENFILFILPPEYIVFSGCLMAICHDHSDFSVFFEGRGL